MARWQDVLSLIAVNVEERYDALVYRLRERLQCDRPLLIAPYRGYGNREKLYVRGRVLQNKGITSARDNDSTWDNLLNMYRRFDSNEIPRARVVARYGAVSQELVADEEGFFETWLPTIPLAGAAGRDGSSPPHEPRISGDLWHEVDLELQSPQCDDGLPVTAVCHVLVPPPSARFAVISDIDDTVIHTNVGHFLKMARTVFLGNARLRLPFEGVGGFYRALYEGYGGNEHNPLFYVSNSPWNMYDLFSDFFQMQDIPIGPILVLRDWGISRRKNDSGPFHARTFKTEAVRRIMAFYPDMSFILIGDSSEKDPEVYEQIVTWERGRVLAVYIRNVSRKPARIQAIRDLAERVLTAGSTLILAENTLPLAEHALAQGWISSRALPQVERAKAADAAPASPVEKLLGAEKKPGPTVVVKEQAPSTSEMQQALDKGQPGKQAAPTVVVHGDQSAQAPGPRDPALPEAEDSGALPAAGEDKSG